MKATGLILTEGAQAKALLHYQHAAYDGQPLAQMAMVGMMMMNNNNPMQAYRYYLGIGVPASCEQALHWYTQVAERVVAKVKIGTSQAIHRTRIIDEVVGGLTLMMIEMMMMMVMLSSFHISIFPFSLQESFAATSGPMDHNLFDYYKFLADKGEASALVGLGQLYLTGGRGVEQDFAKAFEYFQVGGE